MIIEFLEEPNEKTSKAIEDAKKKKDVLGPFDNWH
jgi:hypothetical protein